MLVLGSALYLYDISAIGNETCKSGAYLHNEINKWKHIHEKAP